ncbi:MAG: iron-containing redox enzyme family protein [Alicyclobacillaceae bacterium]|nr:iron-containing redox enzyme family protein [Alicyclobacillaceae bacterium]
MTIDGVRDEGRAFARAEAPAAPAELALRTYEDVEQAVLRVVESAFFQAPFFTHLLQGRYNWRQIRHFAIQYSYYSRHFPRVLGASIAAMNPLESWWIPLADNLWDEAGRGVPGRSHEQLYRTFLLSVDPDVTLDADGIPAEPMSACVQTAVDTFLEFFRAATPLEAMAAVGLGSELFAGSVMGAIGRGFRRPEYNRERTIDVRFWEAHAQEHEPRHYQLCKNILAQYTQPESLCSMYRVGVYFARSEAAMYDGLHQEMMAIR